jgi:NAD+ kinase
MLEADATHQHTRRVVADALRAAGVTFKQVYRARLRPAMVEGRLVVSLGGDGTLLDASHKIKDAPVLGVNSDKAHSVGFLCAAHSENFGALLDDILSGRLKPTRVPRIAVRIDDVPLPFAVLNDVLLCHKNPAATSRYLIEHKQIVEDQRSSGIWASTAAGSTAAMASAGGDVLDLDDTRMQVRTREPFLADMPPYRLAHVTIGPKDEVTVTSKMREGRVYVDGPWEHRDLPTGARLTLRADGPPLFLYATAEMQKRRARALENATRA